MSDFGFAEYDPYADYVDFDKVELERIKIGIKQVVSRSLFDVSVDIYPSLVSLFGHEVDVVVRGFVWGERLPVHQVRYPADWWQAFKERWFPDWALKRWPVRWTVYELDVAAVYPDFRPSLPQYDAFEIVLPWRMDDA